MEEHINSTDVAGKDLNSAGSSNRRSSLQNIYRQGDKIYQVADENVTMIKDTPNINLTPIEEPEQEPLDELASGESLFKTFTFDNAISNDETEKCLTFWRSVVEKNLEPIKFTLIENIAKQNEKEEKKTSATRRSNINNKKTKKSSGQVLKNEITNVKNNKNTWLDILSELQKKRLDQTKLLMEKRCRFCDYLNSPPYENEDSQTQNENMIEELTNWEPKSCPKKGEAIRRRSKRLSLKSKESGGSRKTSADPVEFDAEILEDKSDDKEDTIKEVKEAASKIKYVNAIQEKKENGVYSQWKMNKMAPCNCKLMKCDCNTNPAIKSVLDDGDPETMKKTSSFLQPELNEKKTKECDSSAYRSDNDGDPETMKKTSSFLQPELNEKKTKECDSSAYRSDNINDPKTQNRISILKKMHDVKESKEWDVPAYKSDSLETSSLSDSLETKPFLQDTLSQQENNSEHISYDSTVQSFSRKSSIRTFLDKQKKHSSFASSRLLSIIVPCVCDNTPCDCGTTIQFPEKSPILSLELPIPPKIIPAGIAKRDSVELTKTRLSTVNFSDIKQIEDLKLLEDLEDYSDKKQSIISKGRRSKTKSTGSIDSLELTRQRMSKLSERLVEEEDSSDNIPRSSHRNISVVFK